MATDPHAAKYREALRLYQAGDREGALAMLYSLVTVQPGHRDAWWLIAQLAPRAEQKRQAARRVLELDPAHEDAQALLVRLQQLDAPTAPGAGQPPPGPAAPPVQPGYPPPPSAPPPVDQRYYLDYSEPYQPEEAPRREREVVYVERRRLQPLLVLNGGCASGCFSLLLTVIALAVLAFLIAGDAVNRALQEAGALAAGEGVSLALVAATVVTLLAALAQSVVTGLPVGGFVEGVWSTFGYPAAAGQEVLQRLGSVGAELGRANGLLLVIFLSFWVLLAFLFVFLRARSQRLLHWFLSTVGLWILAGLGCGLAALLFQWTRSP